MFTGHRHTKASSLLSVEHECKSELSSDLILKCLTLVAREKKVREFL